MIQRIQSVYLFSAAIAIGLIFFFPLVELTVNNQFFSHNYRGLYEVIGGKEMLKSSAFILAILLTISLLLSLFTIFKFNNRKFQMKLCLVNIVLLFIIVGLGYSFISSAASNLQATIHYQFALSMPFIAIILSYLAYKGIQKDEKLIKSIDRIR